MNRKRTALIGLILFSLWSGMQHTVSSQSTGYPKVVVDSREITLVPEDTSTLLSSTPIFDSDATLSSLLDSDDTLFWEAIGSYDSALEPTSGVSAFGIVQINESGFFQQVVGLSEGNDSLLWVSELDYPGTTNFSIVGSSAVDFFVDDGRYWGLCEEIVILPGSLVGENHEIVWRFRFHLVAESERWVLLLDSTGSILRAQSEALPCPTCCQYTDLLVIVLASIAVASLGILIWAKIVRESSG
ncbi:hypothetical protein EU520_00015 [Candidatus Thorarchaeota archaeon]|nr:MAG: hypothetical protein EU520_00015 [Candidatus Thorarchaeota archaeon]